MSIDVLRTDGRGRLRPGPVWRRHPADALRMARLASAIEAEADRHAPDSPIRADLDAAAASVRHAAELAVTPD